MKRVTIYVDEGDWASVKDSVWKASVVRGKTVSAGQYLMELHKSHLGAKGSQKPAQPEKFESHRPKGDKQAGAGTPDLGSATGSVTGTEDLGEAYSESNPPPETVDHTLDASGYLSDPDYQSGDAEKLELGSDLGDGKKFNPAEKAKKDLEKLKTKSHKEPKRTKDDKCAECLSPAGHRPACSGRVK